MDGRVVRDDGDPKARPWNAPARKYLKGLLLAAHLSGGGLAQSVEWIHAGERARDHVEDILRTAGHEATRPRVLLHLADPRRRQGIGALPPTC